MVMRRAFPPDLESARSELLEDAAPQKVALDVEDVLNGGLDREEASCRSCRLEPLNLRSRRRASRCAFSARLLARNLRSCAADDRSCLIAAGYDRSRSVVIRSGAKLCFLSSLRRRQRGLGRRRLWRRLRTTSRPNFKNQRRTVSFEALTPRSASISSTSRKDSVKRE